MREMIIPFADFKPMHEEIKSDLQHAYQIVIENSWFIQGEEYRHFEKEFAQFCKANHCIGVANGLDALILVLKALNIGAGDEVIVPSHTFIATALAVSYVGATPVFAEINKNTFLLDISKCKQAITPRTKVIIPVHLYGQMVDMRALNEIAKAYHLYLIEDAAQAHGALNGDGCPPATYSDAATFSFYPGKNLGALGDGGAVVTNSPVLAERIREIANYGSSIKYVHNEQGMNSRLDELQAAFLRAKLKFLPKWNDFRQKIALRYLTEIRNSAIELPVVADGNVHVWHIFAIMTEKRAKLQQYLEENGVQTQIHYPIPMHLQLAYKDLGHSVGCYPIAEKVSETELSLPIYYGMSDAFADRVIELLNRYPC